MPLPRQNEPLLAHTILRTEIHVYHLLAVIMGMIDTQCITHQQLLLTKKFLGKEEGAINKTTHASFSSYNSHHMWTRGGTPSGGWNQPPPCS